MPIGEIKSALALSKDFALKAAYTYFWITFVENPSTEVFLSVNGSAACPLNIAPLDEI